MINACVSHELRNPLNSFASQNTHKERLYKSIDELLQNCSTMEELRSGINKILLELFEGHKIQDSSIKIMTFLIQDMLDYA